MEPPSALPAHSRKQNRTRFNNSDEDWEMQREAIRHLYISLNHPLKKVMAIMRDTYGFQAGERKYKAKIKEWGFEKNIGLSDMMVISAKAAKRAREGKDTLILIGEVPMDPRRLETFKKRKFVKESIPESPSAETPTNIVYGTPESGNPEPSPQSFVPELEQPNLSTRTDGNLDVSALETIKRVAEGERPNALTSMANLASTYRRQGRWTEAEELEMQVMEIRKRVLGQEHSNTLTSMANLASTYQSQGRWIEAEELGVQVMEMRKRVLGQEHPDTLTSMANLAWTYWSQGRWIEAEELEVQVMEIGKRVLGQEHPDTLTSMENLASTYQSQGRWTEAEELEVQVMEIRKRVLGGTQRC